MQTGNSRQIASNDNSAEVKTTLSSSAKEQTNELMVTKPAQLLTQENANSIQPDILNVNTANSIPFTDKKSIWSKFSASIFYAPYLSDELFENESSDNTSINNVMTNEEESNPYMIGLRVGYDISPRLSVITGLYYYNFQVDISPVTIYAQQQQNGEVGYSLQTSLGNVNCQYNGTPCIGDGMKINGTATARYLSIPLQVKYNFINNHKIGFYLTAGATINIVAYNKMTLHWQDFKWEQGDELEGIQSSKSVYASFYAAPGISYRFYKGFSLYVEPSVLGSPSFFAKSSNSNPGPVFVGFGGGLTYHL